MTKRNTKGVLNALRDHIHAVCLLVCSYLQLVVFGSSLRPHTCLRASTLQHADPLGPPTALPNNPNSVPTPVAAWQFPAFGLRTENQRPIISAWGKWMCLLGLSEEDCVFLWKLMMNGTWKMFEFALGSRGKEAEGLQWRSGPGSKSDIGICAKVINKTAIKGLFS